MNNTISVDTKTVNQIMKRLESLAKDVKLIKEKLSRGEPVYGSDTWWEKEIQDSEKEFSAGKGITFKNAKDAITWLDS